MATSILPPSRGSSAGNAGATPGGSGGASSSPFLISSPPRYRRRDLRWPIILLVISVVLGVIGSLDVGRAALLGNNVMTPEPTSIAKPGTLPGSTHTAGTPKVNASPSPAHPQTPTPAPTATLAAQPTQPANNNGTANNPTPVMLASDTFARADQPSWGVSASGYPWKGDADNAGTFFISNGVGVVTNGDGYYDAIIGPNVNNAMVVVSGSMSDYEQMDNNDVSSIAAVLRWRDTDNWYKAFINGSELMIRKHVNGQATDLTSVGFAAQPGVSYTIRFSASGTTLRASVWQTSAGEQTAQVVSADDASFSSGLAGLRLGITSDMSASITSFAEYKL